MRHFMGYDSIAITYSPSSVAPIWYCIGLAASAFNIHRILSLWEKRCVVRGGPEMVRAWVGNKLDVKTNIASVILVLTTVQDVVNRILPLLSQLAGVSCLS